MNYITPSLTVCSNAPADKVYTCKPRFNKLEKGPNALDTLKNIIDETRASLSLQPATIQFTVIIPKPTKGLATLVAVNMPDFSHLPPPKKPCRTLAKSKRSLTFDSPLQAPSSATVSQDAGTQTPEVKVSHNKVGLIRVPAIFFIAALIIVYSSISYSYVHIWIYLIGLPEQVLDDLTIRLTNYNNSYQYRIMVIILYMQVTIVRKGKVKRFNIPKKYKKVVQTLRYKNSPYTATTILKNYTFKEGCCFTACIHQKEECRQMCSRKHGDSVLRFLSVLELRDFKWKMLTQELKKKAPTLLTLFRAAAESKKFLSSDSIVGMAASMILYGRKSQLCIPQAVNSVILYTGHCSKMVWTTY